MQPLLPLHSIVTMISYQMTTLNLLVLNIAHQAKLYHEATLMLVKE
jgi:hypothetical protein